MICLVCNMYYGVGFSGGFSGVVPPPVPVPPVPVPPVPVPPVPATTGL